MSKRRLGHDEAQTVSNVANKKLRNEACQETMSSTSEITLRHKDYKVGWICALPLEMAAAKAMLDNIHADLPKRRSDDNNYTLGRILSHNVVIACLPSGGHGTISAATVAAQMKSSFRSIRFGLMVGIGGGVPGGGADVRLGDLVVSKPTERSGGVEQYDYGKTVKEGRFERTGVLNKPPQVLLTAVSKLQADHMLGFSRIQDFLSEMVAKYPTTISNFTYPGQQHDRLFEAEYDHIGPGDTCYGCDASRLVTRPTRVGNNPLIHYGLIASGNQVMRHGGTRDQLARELGILCFEMEAAGLMDNFPCLVVRGICDYADSHKNEQWQKYAAATAAAYAKELLSAISAGHVRKMQTAARFMSDIEASDDSEANSITVSTDGDSDGDSDSELANGEGSSGWNMAEEDIDLEEAINKGSNSGEIANEDIANGLSDDEFEETGSEPTSDEESLE